MTRLFRILFMVRHAKSSWKDISLADHDRPLNKRGLRNLPIMGQRLANMPHQPEVIISSSALRALTTAKILAPYVGIDAEEVVVDPDLYHAGSHDLMQFIMDLDDHYQSAMLVGHNPGMTLLANELVGQPIDNVPTCGVVVIRFDTHKWSMVENAPSTLLEFDYPKKEI